MAAPSAASRTRAARRRDLGRRDGDDRLELRAQPRLLARRTAGEILDLQENDARRQRDVGIAAKDAGIGAP